jgi:tRNA-modifying protein YgfZ
MNIEAELACLRDGVFVLERAVDTLLVTGPDAQTWLNGLVTCDLAKLSPGDGAYGLACAKNGKVEHEIYFLFPDAAPLSIARGFTGPGKPLEFWLAAPEGAGAALLEKLDRHLIMENAQIAIVDESPKWLFCFGPKSRTALEVASDQGLVAASLSRAGLPLTVVAGADALMSQFSAALAERCAPACLASRGGWHRARIEYGIPELGVDFSIENYPQEAALEHDAVSFQKGCYLGQEAVFMLEKRGHVKKRLVQLESKTELVVGEPIFDDGGNITGNVTSAVSHATGAWALGYVKYKHAREGVVVRVGDASARVTARLALKPDED